MNIPKFFFFPIIGTLLSISILIFLKQNEPKMYYILYNVFVVSSLEIILSFDNAVLNTRILQKMSVFWRKAFLFIGIFISVFLVRLFLPIFLVSASGSLTILDSISLIVNNTNEFQSIINNNYYLMSSFGGSFLIIVSLNFIFTCMWPNFFQRYCRVTIFSFVIASFLSLVFIVFYCTVFSYKTYLVHSLFWGLTSSTILSELNEKLERASINVLGFTAFLYLELLDASFSIDGLLVSFAITQDVLVALVGISIGALYVRSLTIFMLEKDMTYRSSLIEKSVYLSVGFLGLSMWVKNFIDLPDFITMIPCLLPVISTLVSKFLCKKRF